MESINELMKSAAETARGLKIEVKLDLDPKIPKKYENINNTFIGIGLINLSHMLADYNPKKALFRTRLNGDKQEIILAYDGNVSEDYLKKLSGEIEGVFNCESSCIIGCSEHYIAFIALRDGNATVHIEGPDDQYKLRFKVEIPVE